MDKPLSRHKILAAFQVLDQKLVSQIRLIMGGGGAMILAHDFPLATSDVDAIPVNSSAQDLDPFVKQVAAELELPHDWLNPYFSTFSHVLPPDYGTRLKRVFEGEHLTVDAIGREDMLIMKCFAHRAKDIAHAKALIKAGASLSLVEDRIQELHERKVKEAQAALDFLDDVQEKLDDGS